ncbi:hypothetical protein LIPSTDRAFT_322673 [Lipomyces starkeyi NRRL Y-11557]|uniref:Ketoreductase (KR) domain-containing protein n=1 Tax=Lipomyces starkeyi NRRL Y-11557 TaxID=675824 RepID=A0A1E3PUT2_LIPST|nr:hypothetical protein LIPSTDRAFT_322673 [Lipomyces starkeyi NRRL Y-11557]
MSWTSSSTGEELVRAFQDRVRGRTFLITGPSANGIGEATAIALASSPAPPSVIILAGRSQSKTSSVIETIKEINPTISVIFVHLDLSSRTSIETAATTILEDVKVNKIDVLINNAGIMACPYTPLDWSGIGETILESQFVVNYVGVFLFTNLILQKVRKAAPGARIINVSSSGHRFSGIRWDDIGFKVRGISLTACVIYD